MAEDLYGNKGGTEGVVDHAQMLPWQWNYHPKPNFSPAVCQAGSISGRSGFRMAKINRKTYSNFKLNKNKTDHFWQPDLRNVAWYDELGPIIIDSSIDILLKKVEVKKDRR